MAGYHWLLFIALNIILYIGHTQRPNSIYHAGVVLLCFVFFHSVYIQDKIHSYDRYHLDRIIVHKEFCSDSDTARQHCPHHQLQKKME